jgi:hypothetical protein
MKLTIFVFLAFNQFAWGQIQSGTVVYFNFAPDELTVSADSRMNIGTGGHNDTECKISAFGPKFVFTMSGAVRVGPWSGHAVARDIWERESKISPDSTLVSRTLAGWVKEATPIYEAHIADFRKHVRVGGDPVIANAVFAGVDKDGKITVNVVDIDLDLQLFDSTGKAKIIPITHDVAANSSFAIGLDEVAMEFRSQTSERAQDYMAWFKRRISTLPRDQQNAELASKYVELSVLLHPRRDELAFPIDVLELRSNGSVQWFWRKPNCQDK